MYITKENNFCPWHIPQIPEPLWATSICIVHNKIISKEQIYLYYDMIGDDNFINIVNSVTYNLSYTFIYMYI